MVAAGGSSVPIAMDFPVLGGRIVFVPAFSTTRPTAARSRQRSSMCAGGSIAPLRRRTRPTG